MMTASLQRDDHSITCSAATSSRFEDGGATSAPRTATAPFGRRT
jgi:hypothetical protein